MIDLNKDIQENTLLKTQFFQSIQAFPLNDALNARGWLNNFSEGRERNIACYLLEYFMYYPKNMIDQMLKMAVGKSGYSLINKDSAWDKNNFKNECIYSFIPGESPNPTDSGHIFARKLRDSLGIPEYRIVDYSTIHNRLQNESIAPLTIILVDDFVGSGSQCYKAWCKNRGGVKNMTLKEIAQVYKHTFVYAPLIINKPGLQVIEKHCDELILSPAHILESEYNLFSPDCICWKNDSTLYTEGVDLILSISHRLNIPDTDGNDVRDLKGFGKQGLALSFEHGTPDATIPLYYWCDNWTPLVNKVYQR